MKNITTTQCCEPASAMYQWSGHDLHTNAVACCGRCCIRSTCWPASVVYYFRL